ncbi:MAG: hypothetical protein AVDCRST_MAG40-1776, partial [uncultured Gemmatimonadaceae bacterium]
VPEARSPAFRHVPRSDPGRLRRRLGRLRRRGHRHLDRCAADGQRRRRRQRPVLLRRQPL